MCTVAIQEQSVRHRPTALGVGLDLVVLTLRLGQSLRLLWFGGLRSLPRTLRAWFAGCNAHFQGIGIHHKSKKLLGLRLDLAVGAQA